MFEKWVINKINDDYTDKDKIISLLRTWGGNKKVALAAIKKDSSYLKYVSEQLKKDREIILAAINDNGLLLEFAGEQLKNDEEIVMAAIETFERNSNSFLYHPLEYASRELKNNKDFIAKIISLSMNIHGDAGHAFKYASKTLQSDKEFILSLINDGAFDVLEYVSEYLKNDRELAIKAVNINGLALKSVSTTFKNDKDIVLAAVKNNGKAIEYASEALKDDKEVFFEAMNSYPDAYRLISNDSPLYKDKDTLLAILKQNGYRLRYASDELKNDKEVVLAAVIEFGYSLEYASDELKDDKEVVLAAVEREPNAIHHASDRLQADDDILMSVRRSKWPNTPSYYIEKEAAIKKLEQDPFCYAFLDKELKEDEEVILTAICKFEKERVKFNDDYWEKVYQSRYIRKPWYYVPDKFKKDKKFIMKLINICPTVVESLSDELKNDKDIVIAAIIATSFESESGTVYDFNRIFFKSINSHLREDTKFLRDVFTIFMRDYYGKSSISENNDNEKEEYKDFINHCKSYLSKEDFHYATLGIDVSFLDDLSDSQIVYLKALYDNKSANLSVKEARILKAIEAKYNYIVLTKGDIEEEKEEEKKKEAEGIIVKKINSRK